MNSTLITWQTDFFIWIASDWWHNSFSRSVAARKSAVKWTLPKAIVS